MTIIETALERAKTVGPSRSAASGASTAPKVAQHRQMARPTEVLTPPSIQFEPQRVNVDPRFARENRLLLTSSVAADHTHVAAYGMLRSRLLHRARAEGWTSIGVTSAAPQDGKSLTAVNLSLSLAREKNSTVVLIDLDMRNPSVCRQLGVEPPVELRDFFEHGVRSPQELFMSMGVDNFIFAGSISPTTNASELLASARLEELLDFVRKSTTHPIIIIDLPPLPSPDDALVVAPRIDALVLVVSEGITPIAEMHKAVDLISGFPIAGVVLNRASSGGRKYAYGYGYGGGSGKS
jgi:protein-tyrosine kinase